MEDEQRSTPVNAHEKVEWSADDLRVALGGRLRSARSAAGLSQQAVADAMSEHGFNWRQTTVAKVEAADRPTLFTEVVALSQILKRDLRFFLSGRTELDEVKDDLGRETDQARRAVADLENSLNAAKRKEALTIIREGIALAIVEYSYRGDSGPLRRLIDAYVGEPPFELRECTRVFDAAGIPRESIKEIDQVALNEAALDASREADSLGQKAPFGFAAEEIVKQVAEFLSKGNVHPLFFRLLRHSRTYRSYVGQLLVDAITEHVELRHFRLS